MCNQPAAHGPTHEDLKKPRKFLCAEFADLPETCHVIMRASRHSKCSEIFDDILVSYFLQDISTKNAHILSHTRLHAIFARRSAVAKATKVVVSQVPFVLQMFLIDSVHQ